MIEADRADHSRAKLDHDLIVPITNSPPPAVRHVPHTKTRAVVREHSQHPLHHSLPPPSRTLRRVVTQQEQDHRKALNGFHNSK